MPRATTDINTAPEMFETLIRIAERCVGYGSEQFDCLGKQNSYSDIIAHAHIFLGQMRDERESGATIKITQRCLNEILNRIGVEHEEILRK